MGQLKGYTVADLRRIEEGVNVDGYLRFYEREVGRKDWRQVLEAENIVLNGFYNDLFADMGGGIVNLIVNGLALGVGSGVITPARTDTGLVSEWNNPATTLSAAINNLSIYTALTVNATPEPIPIATNIQLGTGQTVVTSAGTAAGATSIPVTSFTASATYAIGTAVNVTSWTPTRMGTTLATPTLTDPPQSVFSFYLAASANLVTLTITEAGMLYNLSTLTPGGSPSNFATHAVFSYSKAVNVDTRIDYTLIRSLT